MSDAIVSHFVWHELLTTDPKAAMAFYGDVVGWKTQPWENGQYTMWVASQGPLGGTMELPEPARKMGTPPHWTANVAVKDVDATVVHARERGGRVYVEPNDIPNVGRFAVIADPQGASISVFRPSGPMALHDTTKPGEFCWGELATSDHEAAFRFYSELFGWKKLSDFDMGPGGKYLIYGVGDVRLGGMFTKPKEMAMPPAWIYYAQVADLDAAVARAKAKGAKLLNGPMEVPGGAHIAQLTDPQGVFFALHEEAKTKRLRRIGRRRRAHRDCGAARCDASHRAPTVDGVAKCPGGSEAKARAQCDWAWRARRALTRPSQPRCSTTSARIEPTAAKKS
jgi:predicted enzyme related to lactoylglutathione lyase